MKKFFFCSLSKENLYFFTYKIIQQAFQEDSFTPIMLMYRNQTIAWQKKNIMPLHLKRGTKRRIMSFRMAR